MYSKESNCVNTGSLSVNFDLNLDVILKCISPDVHKGTLSLQYRF